MNFQYIEAYDVECLNFSFEFEETVFSLNEGSTEKSNSSEEKVQGEEKSYEGLILKELPKHLKYAFLGSEKSKPVIIVVDLIEEKEKKILHFLRKYK